VHALAGFGRCYKDDLLFSNEPEGEKFMKHVALKSQRDKVMIEATVRRFGPISRVAIHDLTRLEHSLISRHVRQLLDEGKLLEVGHGANPMGRKQVLLRLNEEHAYVVGIGFDDEEVLTAVMNLEPRVKLTIRQATRLDEGVDGLIAQLISCASEAIQQAGVNPRSVIGVGLAGSGLVETRSGNFVMSSTIDFLQDVPFERIMEEHLGYPAIIENLTRAKTVAERMLGAGRMAEDVIYVEYGRTGIGAGIIQAGQLLHGSGSAAGELGHTHVMPDGPACKCGSFGCLEAIAGAAALESKVRRAIAEGSSSAALAMAGGDITRITGWTVLEAARMDDKTCTAIVEQAANYLGLGLANLVNLFNPSILVLDHRLSFAGGSLLDHLIKVVKRQALRHSTRDLEICFARLGHEASVLGAASIVLERHFEIPILKPPRFMTEKVPMPVSALGLSKPTGPHVF
jgi:predicted NBD/HSP70 family sugar kinase